MTRPEAGRCPHARLLGRPARPGEGSGCSAYACSSPETGSCNEREAAFFLRTDRAKTIRPPGPPRGISLNINPLYVSHRPDIGAGPA